MKNLFILGAVLCGTLFSSYGFTQDYAGPVGGGNPDLQPRISDPGCPSGGPTGECYCLYVRHEPVCCDKWRCVDVPYTVQKKCCRQVPKYYTVQKCRYVSVPQYYSEQCCKYETEEYCVDECRSCKKYVCDKETKYVPRYYWKHSCNQAQGYAPQGCGPQGCAQ